MNVPEDELMRGGADPADVVKTVRWALTAANIRAGKEEGLGFDLDSITLELSVVQTLSAGGGFKLTIPWVDWEFGGTATISRAQTQVISVEVGVPTADEAIAEGPPVDVALQDALLQIASMVRSIETADPGLSLREASVQIQFTVSKSGELSLVTFKGKREDATTHSLTVGVK